MIYNVDLISFLSWTTFSLHAASLTHNGEMQDPLAKDGHAAV